MAKKAKESRVRTAPTGSGWVLMAILFAMLLASMNYSNNMGYTLCFLLTSLMLVSFLYTRYNLKRLDITNVQTQPVFAGETPRFTFDMQNNSSARRTAIYAGDLSGPFSVVPNSCVTAEISVLASKRGRFTLSGITLWTVYPMGLFRARCHIRINKVYIVYPKPVGTLRWPPLENHEEEASEGFYARGGDDFVGVRPWRPGESMHHIDWKAVARGRPLSIKEFTGGGTEQLWFDWYQLGSVEMETRLSQLARWVLEAAQEGREFGLRMPNRTIPVDSSPGHTTKCLETLAVFRVEP
jgi:uncharacterized protein (DUF58 family)